MIVDVVYLIFFIFSSLHGQIHSYTSLYIIYGWLWMHRGCNETPSLKLTAITYAPEHRRSTPKKEAGSYSTHPRTQGQAVTLWKINMEPENDGLEDDFPFQMGDLEVPAVNLPGCSFREANMAFLCSHSLGPRR